jgi:uncharacterized protein
MPPLPAIVREAWENRKGSAVLGTVSPDGVPNVIYVSCVGAFGGDRFVVVDNFFDKTRKNLLAGSKGALLFRAKDGKAYQVKGALEYHTDGEISQHMKTWNSLQHPGHAATALQVEEVYSGAKNLA